MLLSCNFQLNACVIDVDGINLCTAGKALESFPPELEKAVPLEPLSVLPYCDRLAPHYEAVAYIVGADTTVRWLRQGNDDLPNKVFRILEEWILTGKATWATLVLRLEHYIPRLRGLASDIRKDLREALEKCEHTCKCLLDVNNMCMTSSTCI